MKYGLTLLLNNTCNKRCKYCYENNIGDSVMTTSQIDYILKRVWNLPGFNKEVLFFGGEPTLSINTLRECIKKYTELKYSIITNGYFLLNLDYEDYEFLKNVCVNISLEGTSRAFKELRGDENLFVYLEKIKKLVDLGWKNITVNISVNGILLKDIDEFIRVCLFLRNIDVGVHLYSLNGDDFFNSTEDYLELLLKVGKKSNWLLKKIVGNDTDCDSEFLCALENSMTFDGDLCLVDCGRNKSNPIKLVDLTDEQLLLEFATRVSKTHISLFPACQECEVPVGNCTRSCPAYINEMLALEDYDKLNSSCEKEIVKNKIRTGQLIIEEELIDVTNDISHIELIVSGNCNMRCKYCFEYKNVDTNIMSVETLINALNFAIDRSKSNSLDITLFGGEPLIHGSFEVRNELLKYIMSSEKNINVLIVTNLLNVTDDDLLWMRNMEKYCNKFIIQISIDSTKDTNDKFRVNLHNNGTFDIVVNNMKKLSKYVNVDNITINSVIYELDHVDNLANWMKYLDSVSDYFSDIQYNFDQCKKYYVIDKWRTHLEKTINEVFNLYKCNELSLKVVKPFLQYSSKNVVSNSASCDALLHSITVDPDGWIIPCHFNMHETDKRIYNINTGDYGNNFRNILLSYNYHDNFICSACDISSDCRRCKVAGFGMNAGIPRFTCEIYKMLHSIKESIVKDQFRTFDKNELNAFKLDMEELMRILESDECDNELSNVICQMVKLYNQRRR